MDEWRKMAQDSLYAASVCLRRGLYRSAVSRAYFAAYQVATDALRQVPGLRPPLDREGWSHERTPGLLMENVRDRLGAERLREVIRRLRSAYRERLDADYHGERLFDESSARRCFANAQALWDALTG